MKPTDAEILEVARTEVYRKNAVWYDNELISLSRRMIALGAAQEQEELERLREEVKLWNTAYQDEAKKFQAETLRTSHQYRRKEHYKQILRDTEAELTQLRAENAELLALCEERFRTEQDLRGELMRLQTESAALNEELKAQYIYHEAWVEAHGKEVTELRAELAALKGDKK